MRLAVISDIHANLDALASVLEDIDQNGLDAVISLGDNIGYGAEPNEVIRMLRQRDIPSVLGNHEWAVVHPEKLTWFNPVARASLEKTIDMLTDVSLAYISGLPTYLVRHGCRFVHGFPPDSPTLYRFEIPSDEKRCIMENLPERICFIGHTHELHLIAYDGSQLIRQPLDRGVTDLAGSYRYIISVGSVGQPRDGNNNGKYVIFDDAGGSIEIRYVPYDVRAAADKIIAAGLPKVHAERLF
jgi:predicted phosphodiesterase